MGKFRVMVGVGASDRGAPAWSAVARRVSVDGTSPGRVEPVALTPSPEPAATAAGGSPTTGNPDSPSSAEFDVGLLRVGASAVVAVRSRRPA
jgi:hypothetical protein